MKPYAQVAGCREVQRTAPGAVPFREIEGFVPDEQAHFWGLYLGEPGDYQCIGDFDTKVEALAAAREAVAQGHAERVDDRTFSEVKK